MDDFASKRGLPLFPAHVTLGSNYESLEDAFKVAEYYRDQISIKLVNPVKPHLFPSSQDWSKVIVLLVSIDPAQLPAQTVYPPHISLCYEPTGSETIRQEMLEEIT
jgi:hypothetical protein